LSSGSSVCNFQKLDNGQQVKQKKDKWLKMGKRGNTTLFIWRNRRFEQNGIGSSEFLDRIDSGHNHEMTKIV
jgi:hypothetical protein